MYGYGGGLVANEWLYANGIILYKDNRFIECCNITIRVPTIHYQAHMTVDKLQHVNFNMYVQSFVFPIVSISSMYAKQSKKKN